MLTVSSYPTRTSVVLRGKYLLENVLNAPPPPPPPDVPALDEEAVGTAKSLRAADGDSIARTPLCAICHTQMDPLGFALENYDAIGRWRTQDGKFPVDSSGAFPNGKTFTGPAEMKAAAQGQHARVHAAAWPRRC